MFLTLTLWNNRNRPRARRPTDSSRRTNKLVTSVARICACGSNCTFFCFAGDKGGMLQASKRTTIE